jgi:hypothetical protein
MEALAVIAALTGLLALALSPWLKARVTTAVSVLLAGRTPPPGRRRAAQRDAKRIFPPRG